MVAQYTFKYLLISIKIAIQELLSEIKAAVFGFIIAYGIGFLALDTLHLNFIVVGTILGIVFASVEQELIQLLKPQKISTRRILNPAVCQYFTLLERSFLTVLILDFNA